MFLTSTQGIVYTPLKINTEVQMDRIRQLRKEQGLSQAKLAVMADMDPATLNRLERGSGNPNLKTLQRVADALDVGITELLEHASPKARRRSSLEPTLLNGLEEERHPSRFSEAIIAAAERWGEAVSSPDMDNTKRIAIIAAALELSDLVNERAEDEGWEAIPPQEQLEIVSTMEKLTEAAGQGIRYLEEAGEAKAQEEEVKQRREQIRERTRRMSA
jgi:transcriptional regulator with XRE-family HTH domain